MTVEEVNMFLVIFMIIVIVSAVIFVAYLSWEELKHSVVRFYNKHFKRPSELQKEISDTERDIKILKAQKADMERLSNLKQERAELFREVNVPKKKVFHDKTDDELPSITMGVKVSQAHCRGCGEKRFNHHYGSIIKCANCGMLKTDENRSDYDATKNNS